MPQVSDFIGENTDIWNFNNLNIDFHPILPTYPEFNDESAKVQVLCKNHFLSKKSYSHIAHCTWNIVSIWAAALWSCISNPIRPDNLGCVGSHYNQQQEHQEHNLIFRENYDLRWWRVGELRENTFHQIICIAFKIGTEYRGHVNICVLGENIDIWKLLTLCVHRFP